MARVPADRASLPNRASEGALFGLARPIRQGPSDWLRLQREHETRRGVSTRIDTAEVGLQGRPRPRRFLPRRSCAEFCS